MACYFVKATDDKMSDLEMGMVNMITVFHKYSGHRGKLKKADLKALINNEMNNFIKVRFGISNGNDYMLTQSILKHFNQGQLFLSNVTIFALLDSANHFLWTVTEVYTKTLQRAINIITFSHLK